jgi:hypothetical protein
VNECPPDDSDANAIFVVSPRQKRELREAGFSVLVVGPIGQVNCTIVLSGPSNWIKLIGPLLAGEYPDLTAREYLERALPEDYLAELVARSLTKTVAD